MRDPEPPREGDTVRIEVVEESCGVGGTTIEGERYCESAERTGSSASVQYELVEWTFGLFFWIGRLLGTVL